MQLLGKPANPCFMASQVALMACGANHAIGARITTRLICRSNLTKKGTHYPLRAHAVAPRPMLSGLKMIRVTKSAQIVGWSDYEQTIGPYR